MATVLPPSLSQSIVVDAAGIALPGDLTLAAHGSAVVVFAHGSGSSRNSPRNRAVAAALNAAGLGALLFDLLTPEEERLDRNSAALRFDVHMLGMRLEGACRWLVRELGESATTLGCFGASTGAAAALRAAAAFPSGIAAVVSRGGRPDLAGEILPDVEAPTLLIVGGEDWPVIELNQRARQWLRAPNELRIVEGASHLFEEPGALESVARLAAEWFRRHLLGEPG
ncbi:MAG TPA: dienelactone hydrolase family protein [Xanthomonadales bacterium]|nr:dienelactone hydrolase family protein [Xanthomonadales bacterium]